LFICSALSDLGIKRSKLSQTNPKHPLVVDLAEKAQLFDAAAVKFSPAVATAA
jgi:hypothetical protein